MGKKYIPREKSLHDNTIIITNERDLNYNTEKTKEEK